MFSEKSVENALMNQGLILNVGLFSFNIQSSIRSLSHNVTTLYQDYPDGFSEDRARFIDFHICVEPPNLWHKYYKGQVQFFSDGFAPFTPLPYQHAPAIIEWGMNWCVSQLINTHLIIHAAVIEKNGFAAIMPAPPGSGKSTLTASLVQEGWRLLSDELTLIRIDNYQVSPFPRPISLKNQSINVIKQRYPDVVFGIESTDTSKGTVVHIRPPKLSIELQGVECPVAWVIFPKYEEDAETELTIKSKAKSLMDVADNSFNYSRLGVIGFDVLKNIIEGADCYQFRYSQLDEAIDAFAALELPQ